jgi:hypothetical protein
MRSIACVLITVLAIPVIAFAQGFSLSEVQHKILREQAMELIANYNANLNSLGDPSLEVVEKEMFVVSIVEDIYEEKKQLVYNDLEPGRKSKEHLPAEIYLQNIITQYSGGLEITFDNIKLSDFFYDEAKKRPFIKAELKSSYKGVYIGKSVSGGEALELYIGYKINKKGNIESSRIYAVERAGTGKQLSFKRVNINSTSEAVASTRKADVSFARNTTTAPLAEAKTVYWSKFTTSAILTDKALLHYQPVFKEIAWNRPFTTMFSAYEHNDVPFARPLAAAGSTPGAVKTSKSNLAFTTQLAGKKFKTGGTLPIAWTYSNSSKVKVELLRNGKFYRTIYDAAPGVSTRRWKIPSNLPASKLYTIRVSSLDDPGVSLTTNEFSIVRSNSVWQKSKKFFKF